MSKSPTAKATVKQNKQQILRYAHPFFTDIAPEKRKTIPGIGKQMTDYISTKLESIPLPQREPTMSLDEIIGNAGVTEIENAKSIIFHAAGDTGHESGVMQELVAEAMSLDYNIHHPEKSPAFFLHLGDVNYYDNTDQGYQAQFYIPYKKYPGKIIAIPGNHDGELYTWKGISSGQKTTLDAFIRNFCQPKPAVPPAAGTIYREMISQPGVYWVLNTPFIDIIGLYSNVAEGPGFISAPSIGKKQKDWLTKTLIRIKKTRKQNLRKALLLAVHHPPFSSGGHSSSVEMLKDIDDCCTKSEVFPDAVIAAHDHDYQRYTRFISFKGKEVSIPYIVAGCGGHGLASGLKKADGSRTGDHTYDKCLLGYGYLLVTATNLHLTIEMIEVLQNQQGFQKQSFEKIIVNLKTNGLG
ncbi:metallophosphoesterase [Ginsengibacter hankyongi]|uniref:Metallophosphoesterase n=1 Tax=Ginsengibacter hankyongi TaxID=2607284 RepID=A0A5J5IIV5_9BACT|nr:metallophosphoesterase [Ginsengibacter hankyongi]KAA9040960.1 metallophosphoesterase [Ginsengibacter hankyongi]